jgi:hypothetical protein
MGLRGTYGIGRPMKTLHAQSFAGVSMRGLDGSGTWEAV